MQVLIIFIFFVALVILFLWLTRGARIIKKKVLPSSSIIYGSKGSGKSLLFQYMANKCSKKNGYLSNVDFGGNRKIIKLTDISVYPNTYENTIKDIFYKIKKQPFEDKPVFLDDCAVYLPNYADSQLKKTYPSMPIAYAVWRHLYNAPIYLNCQTLERTWKPLREQADTYVKARWSLRLPFFSVVAFRFYDMLTSAELDKRPMASRLLNKFSKGLTDEYQANNGTIVNAFVFIRNSKIFYDSRYFHKKFFGRKSPTSK